MSPSRLLLHCLCRHRRLPSSSTSGRLAIAQLATAAMPLKRKRNGPPPAPSQPKPDAPRRSSRRNAKLADNSTDITASSLNSREAVERAVQDLSQMELRLQSEAKRQRLAVESSDLSMLSDADAAASNTAAKNNADDAAKAVVVDALADATVPDAASEGDIPEKGARRPPPVNSEKLPLPWSGRLGYVRMPREQSPSQVRHAAFTPRELTSDPGLPQHISEDRKPAGVLLADLSPDVHSRAPSPAAGPFSA